MRHVIKISAITLLTGLLITGCATQAPIEWEATPAPATPALADSDRAAALLELESSARENFKIKQSEEEPPAASFVSAVQPREWNDTFSACMAEGGFPSVEINSGVRSEGYQGNELEYDRRVYVCQVSHPIDPVYTQKYSAEEADYIFRYRASELVSCLAKNDVDFGAVPSRDEFMANYEKGSEWNPFDYIRGIATDEFYELYELCPSYPAGFRGN